MALPIKNFYGEIDGISMRDLTKELDYSLKTYNERKDKLEEILYDEDGQPIEFFEEVFTQDFDKRVDRDKCVYVEELDNYIPITKYIELYGEDKAIEEGYISGRKNHTGLNNSHIKLVIGAKDNLYSETNIAKGLERMADYLLMAEDVERDKGTQYNFYKEEDLIKKDGRNGVHSLDGTIERGASSGKVEAPEVLDFLIRKGNNYKLETKQKFYKKDFEDEDLKEVCEPYKKEIERIKKTMSDVRNKKIKNIPLRNIYAMGHCLKGMREDLVDIKEIKKGTIRFKQPLVDTTAIDYDQFDFMDKEMVVELLKIKPRTDLQDDLACLTQDLQKIIKECNLDKKELEIIDMLRSEYTIADMARELNMSRQGVQSLVNKIVNKIMDKYEDTLEEWYYLNIVKGKYKKCSKCGKIKIANERHFRKDKNRKDGFFPYCKTCINK